MRKALFIMRFDAEGGNPVILLLMFEKFAVLKRMRLFVRNLSFRIIQELSVCYCLKHLFFDVNVS